MYLHEVTPEEYNQISYSALETFGEDMQLIVIIEELAELTQALTKYIRHGEEYINNVEEEAADVKNCIMQLEILFNRDNIKRWQDKKIKRMESRIKSYLSKTGNNNLDDLREAIKGLKISEGLDPAPESKTCWQISEDPCPAPESKIYYWHNDTWTEQQPETPVYYKLIVEKSGKQTLIGGNLAQDATGIIKYLFSGDLEAFKAAFKGTK